MSISGKQHCDIDKREVQQHWAEAVWKRKYLLDSMGNHEMLDEAFH